MIKVLKEEHKKNGDIDIVVVDEENFIITPLDSVDFCEVDGEGELQLVINKDPQTERTDYEDRT